eukprot:5128374-Prymnesium_polylepis.1
MKAHTLPIPAHSRPSPDPPTMQSELHHELEPSSWTSLIGASATSSTWCHLQVSWIMQGYSCIGTECEAKSIATL